MTIGERQPNYSNESSSGEQDQTQPNRDQILEESLSGWDVSGGRELEPDEVKKREVALRHYAMWVRRAYPEKLAEEIRLLIAGNLTPDTGEAFLRSRVAFDDADKEMHERRPDWKNWYERD